MTYTIDATGWVRGSIPGPDMEYEVEVIPSDNNPHRPLKKNPPDLCLHTTEGSHVNPAMEYEPQWIVGEHRIVQLHPVRCKGYSVDTQDDYLMQVECVAKSTLKRGVFPDPTQLPLVALVAFLHCEGLITTGLARPASFRTVPVVLDRLPAAVDYYYRRYLASEPTVDGVRGHVDIKDDEHWDPGSYDYPTFFQQVEELIGGDDELAVLSDDQQHYLVGLLRYLNGYGPPADDAPAKVKEGFNESKAKLSHPEGSDSSDFVPVGRFNNHKHNQPKTGIPAPPVDPGA